MKDKNKCSMELLYAVRCCEKYIIQKYGEDEANIFRLRILQTNSEEEVYNILLEYNGKDNET